MTVSLIGYLIRKVLKVLKNVSHSFIQILLLDQYLYVHAATKHGLKKCLHVKKYSHPSRE